MAREWSLLQDLVFNFGAELASNPTQYMMEQCFRDRGLNWRYIQFEFGPEKLRPCRGRRCHQPARYLVDPNGS